MLILIDFWRWCAIRYGRVYFYRRHVRHELTNSMASHKNTVIAPPSDRSFGFLFTAVFMLFGYYFYQGSITWVEYVFGGLCCVTCVITVVRPSILSPFNRSWMLFGHLLGRVVNPIVLGIIFYAIVTPVAIIARWCGRDELRLKLDRSRSHWKLRDPVDRPSDSFRNQF